MMPVDIQGHRGARGLWPENSLAGFAGAIALGVTSVELDVRLTADLIPVVVHDAVLNPGLVRDASGSWLKAPGAAIGDLTLYDLAAYDIGRARPGSRIAARFPRQRPIDGARIPTLAAVCALVQGTRARLDIELKFDAASPAPADIASLVRAVLGVLDEAGPALRASVRAFAWSALAHVRALRPSLPLAWLSTTGTAPAIILASVAQAGWPDVRMDWRPVWAPDHRGLRRRDIDAANDHGLSVKPWTVNDPRRMAQLLSWGCEGLCTDTPDAPALAVHLRK